MNTNNNENVVLTRRITYKRHTRDVERTNSRLVQIVPSSVLALKLTA